jgi:hypothetical protein
VCGYGVAGTAGPHWAQLGPGHLHHRGGAGEAEVDVAARAWPERERGTAVASSELAGCDGEDARHLAGMPVPAQQVYCP